MKHLSPEVLGALLDGALDDVQRQGAERHLESCSDCQAALAALVAQDELTMQALVDDPGDAYFDSFAGRVSARIGAEDRAAAAQRKPSTGWWHALWSPRGLAMAGSVAAILVVSVLVLQHSQTTKSALATSELADRAQQQDGSALTTKAPAPSAANSGEAKDFTPQAPAAERLQANEAAPDDEREQAHAKSSAPQEARELAGTVRRESAPTAQQSVVPQSVLEERPSGSRNFREVAPSEARAMSDAAPAPAPPATAGGAADTRNDSQQDVMRSLKARALSPLDRQRDGDVSKEAGKSFAQPPAVGRSMSKMDESAVPPTLPAWLLPSVAQAESLSTVAAQANDAKSHDAAAVAWEGIAGRTKTLSARYAGTHSDVLASIAEERSAAWSIEPTAARRAAARKALDGALAIHPRDSRRDHLEALLTRIREGAESR